jgi:hypothetical protein
MPLQKVLIFRRLRASVREEKQPRLSCQMTASICIVPGRNGVRDHGNQSIGAEIEHIGDANASDRGRHLPPLISDRRVGTGRLI